MEVLLISDDLLGTSGRPIWSKSVCTPLPGSQGWLEDGSLCCKRAIERREMPTCFGERAPWSLTQLPGTIFRSNEKNHVQGQPLNMDWEGNLCNSYWVICWRQPCWTRQRTEGSPSASSRGGSAPGQGVSAPCCYTHFCDTMLQTTQKLHYFYVCFWH